MKIAVLGTGIVGQTLGAGLAARGHEVMLGSREADNAKLKEWVAKTGGRVSGGTFAQAAEFGELIILATLGAAAESVIGLMGAKRAAGKVVIDTTNPLKFEEGKPPSLYVGNGDSGGEQVQRWLPAARVVKAFNTVGSAHMVNPSFSDGVPDMFICGNDQAAKQTVTALLVELGWPAIDIGGIEESRLLEPLCVLWVKYGLRTGTWNHAFKLLRQHA